MSDAPKTGPKPAAKPRAPKPAVAKPLGAASEKGERIAKVLSRAGVASRREAERMIELGDVSVNGKVIDSPALNVTPQDRITVRGEPLAAPEPARLWLYYKPDGLVTSASDEKGRETVFDRLPEDLPRVMSIGRLDLNSEGLLLLTNDGELKRRLELPSTGWLRKYRVRVKGNPTDVDLEPLRKGITVEGERFQPMMVTLDRHQGANAWVTVALREGKNREIRRAMTAIGVTVNRLIRISYGPFRLGDLEPGQVEEVKGRVLRDQLGQTGDEADEKPARSGGRPGATAKPAGAKPVGAKPVGAKSAGTTTGARPAGAKPAHPRAGGPKAAAPHNPRGAAKLDDSDPTKRARRTGKPQPSGESRKGAGAAQAGRPPQRPGSGAPKGGPAKPRRS
ncbi:MAG: pseudouridine synthase [Pseudomonadota bacterium]